MGLFSSDTKKKVTKAKKVSKAKKPAVMNADTVLKAPWMSEKALIGTEKGVYVFEVPPEATKTDVIAAMETIYKVTPRQIRMVNLPGKRKALRHKRGMGTRARRHKAYVYLKSGATITLV